MQLELHKTEVPEHLRKYFERVPALAPKNKCMIPAKVAIALQEDGWVLRQEIVWAKLAPMPESTRDRPTTAHEMVYLFSKQPRYFYDQEAERVPIADSTGPRMMRGVSDSHKTINGAPGQPPHSINQPRLHVQDGGDPLQLPNGRNLWSFWLLSPDNFKDAHFATFPRELARRCISLGTSAYGCCAECKAPWARVVERESAPPEVFTNRSAPEDGFVHSGSAVGGKMRGHGQKLQDWRDAHPPVTLRWQPTCTHSAPVQPCTVLDPFSGAGTTGVVAVGLGRAYLGIELSPVYTEMSERRIAQTQPALPGMAV